MTSIRTGKSSILKNFESRSRDLVKNSITNRVRFELITHKRLHEILLNIEANKVDSVRDYNQYLSMIRDVHISESDFLSAIRESKECVEQLIKYEELAKALMKLDWARHNAVAVQEYQSFLIDLLSSHNKFVKTAVHNMVTILVPRATDEELWSEGKPTPVEEERIRCVLNTLRDILEVIPLSANILLDACQETFPFYSAKPFIYVGYFRNMLEVMQLSPAIQRELFARIIPKLILLDANTPRQDIDDAENSDSDSDSDDDEMFEMEVDERKVKPERNEDEMKSPQAEALDLCMNQLFDFVKREHSKERKGTDSSNSSIYATLIDMFETYLLPAHNTHHVQFLLFYFCSFDSSFAESFTNTCWQKLNRLNCPNPIRQASVGYLASMLTRSLFISVDVLKDYLDDMCGWIRQYIQRCDSGQNAYTLKAHSVFYATCQAVFYIISFRSRDLTSSNKHLMFLQSLQLNTIVTCNLNPLRYCLPAVATAFSGVTRAHQLAYCHTVLERNARRKLATIYTNDLFATEDVLETFFPFDQYMLKRSGRRIAAIYREYQSSEAEEHVHEAEDRQQKRRKCMESGSFVEDMEDFIMRDKRSKIAELSKSFDRDLQFHNINNTK